MDLTHQLPGKDTAARLGSRRIELAGEALLRYEVGETLSPNEHEEALSALAVTATVVDAAADHYLLQNPLHPTSVEVARLAFRLSRALPLPDAVDRKMIGVLRLTSLGLAGGDSDMLQRWRERHSEELVGPPMQVLTSWGARTLVCLYECWMSVFSGQSAAQVAATIDDWAQSQEQDEATYLASLPADRKHEGLATLVALYHMIEASHHASQGQAGSASVLAHLDAAEQACQLASDPMLAQLVRSLRASLVHLSIRGA